MKKILLSICIIISINTIGQDSTKITIAPQTRDLEYISFLIFNDYSGQEVFDTLKSKFRVANPPTNLTTVSVSGYTIDWLSLYSVLNDNPLALKSGTASRIETLLRAVNQVYLTSKLDAIVSKDQSSFSDARLFGRIKLRRQ